MTLETPLQPVVTRIPPPKENQIYTARFDQNIHPLPAHGQPTDGSIFLLRGTRKQLDTTDGSAHPKQPEEPQRRRLDVESRQKRRVDSLRVQVAAIERVYNLQTNTEAFEWTPLEDLVPFTMAFWELSC